MKKEWKIFSVLVLMLIVSCNKNEDNNEESCDETVIISNSQFNNSDSNIFDINDIAIMDDCLIANISASGCDGGTWVLKLIDSDEILESDPPQRTLRLTLLNQEACLAFITREISFNISSLQVDGGQVQLNLLNSGESYLYTY
jgi:hypothetical protein